MPHQYLHVLVSGETRTCRNWAVPISACPKFKKNMQTKVRYFGDQICSKPFDMSWSHLKPGHASQSGFRLPEMYKKNKGGSCVVNQFISKKCSGFPRMQAFHELDFFVV